MLHQHANDLPIVPARVRTRDGFDFDPRPDSWHLESRTGSGKNWRFGEFAASGERFIRSLKLGLVALLEEYSFDHSRNLFDRFRDFYMSSFSGRHARGGLVDLEHLLHFRSRLNQNTLWKLGTLRILLIRLHEANLGISTDAAIEYLRRSRIPGNPTGVDIRTRDPKRGAFSTTELEMIHASITQAYVDGKIDLPDFALAVLMLAFGMRPVQAANLKERDFVVGIGSNGQKVYLLQVPRAKQLGKRHRQEMKTRRCAQNVGALLETLLEHNAQLRQARGIKNDDPALFLGRAKGKIPGFAWHETNSNLGSRLERTLRLVCPNLKANPKRFRHTLAQRLADMGVSKHVIAELLDHSSTSHVGVYTEATPSAAARLSRKLAMDMAPLAQAFQGMHVAPAHQVSASVIPGGRIHDRSMEDSREPLGGCGTMGFCGLHVPVACYTCRHFQPILEGPHEAELEKLLAEREHQRVAGYAAKIVEILDRTILAVAEVVAACEALRSGRGGAG
ncbi:site-specific integrase [Belnapia sp. T18]|uniref:Site-specific integrase n=1 Tax=Belnapia arida TaxID=2804533 RepID=A0ABS1U0H3_9PROT|nr:site-specific integrase [Belnapia arida]MBL6078186.1 site-specific integrase [Belnapia arida]